MKHNEYITTYQEYKNIQLQIKNGRRVLSPEEFQKLKAKEREILNKLNKLL